jgi:5'-nucleotidase
MEKPMLIGIDIDDTVADLVPTWIKRYNQKYSDTLAVKEISDWDISKFVKPECGKKIYDLLIKNLYDDVLPIFGAIKGIHALREQGHQIVYITSFCPTTAGRKYDWLKEYHLIENLREYMECNNKALVRIDILIDDRAETIQNLSKSTIGILYNRPWNVEAISHNLRARSWKDVLSFVNKINAKFA